MNDPMLPLPGLSPVSAKPVVARFDGGHLSSDGGVLLLREIAERLGFAERLAACMHDPRDQDQIVHTLANTIRFRTLMIASGYEDGNGATALRSDPAFKLAQGVLPSGPDLASQSTISRLENLSDIRTLLRMEQTLIDFYCASYARVPKRIVLDFDDTFDAVHGGQQLRLFNAHYDEYGFQPIVVFDGDGRFVAAVLRPAKRPSGMEIRVFLRRLLRAIRANGLDFILGTAPTATLRRHVKALEESTKARFDASAQTAKVRRYKEFYDGAASWSRVERIVARVEAGPNGPDTRFIVTNLPGGRPKMLYEDICCQRGRMENHIKSWKTHLAADRTSCGRSTANQFRLFLHAGAYWLMWALRNAMPKRSAWRVAQFDTLRLKLIKIAARVEEMKTQVRLHLPSAYPFQAILRTVLVRLPRPVT